MFSRSAQVPLPLFLGQRPQRQGVDLGFHRGAERCVHGGMAGDGVLAAEGFRDDEDPKVAASGCRTRVAGVLFTFVLNGEMARGKCPAQGCFNPFHTVHD